MPPALPKEMVPVLLSTGASARVAENVAARYRAGDAVIARNINPIGHTRLPRYIRSKRGTVRADHGVFSFPDTAAHGQGHKAQHLYSVRFMARELWGDQASPHDSIYIDLFDDYLDLDPAAPGAEPAASAGTGARPAGRPARRSVRPARGRAGGGKPRKARRPGVRLQKKEEAPVSTASRARASRKAAVKKKGKRKAAKPINKGARKPGVAAASPKARGGAKKKARRATRR